MKKKQNILTSFVLLVTGFANAQSWTASGGNLTTSASKVGIGISAPQEKLTIQDGHLALTSSAYPWDNASTYRYITAKTYRSALMIGTNPDVATSAANGPVIQMFGSDNGWIPGRINYFSYASIGGSHGTTIAQSFSNLTSSSVVPLMNLHDFYGKSVVTIGDLPMPASGAYGLHVERGILTERVRVAVKGSSEWADYVFADDYKLMPIEQLEKYIARERHLPEVPSADDVIRDGVDIGAMQAKLLQKIEELTLYVIQQQKEIDYLKGIKK